MKRIEQLDLYTQQHNVVHLSTDVLLEVSHQCAEIGGFRIQTEHRLLEFDFDAAIAYRALQISSGSQDFYALVYNAAPARLNEMMAIYGAKVKQVAAPVAIGIQRLTPYAPERLTVIIPCPKGKRLDDIIKSGVKLDDSVLLHQVTVRIASVINSLHEIGVMCGNINYCNIYIDAAMNITLMPCFVDPCGFAQLPFFETIQRSQSHPAAKSCRDFAADYYALGVLLFCLALNKVLDASSPAEQVLQEKLVSGTYEYLVRSNIVTGKVHDIIRGLVIDDYHHRFCYTELMRNIAKKGPNIGIAYQEQKYIFAKPVKFQDKCYYSLSSLVYALHKNWPVVKEMLVKRQFYQWLVGQPQLQQISDLITNSNIISRPSVLAKQKYYRLDKYDLQLACILLIMEPDAPIRLPEISFYPDALGVLISYSLFHVLQIKDKVLDICASGIFNAVASIHNIPGAISKQCRYIETLYSYTMRSSQIGFGQERFIYELHSSLPCTQFADKLIFNLKSALQVVEMSDSNLQDMLNSPWLLSFLAAKANIREPIKLDGLEDLGILHKDMILHMLALFVKVQQAANLKEMSRLCNKFSAYVKNTLCALLHGASIKTNMLETIDIVSQHGICENLLNAVISTQYIKSDIDGYAKAVERSKKLVLEYNTYRALYRDNYMARTTGIRLALNIGYVVCILSIMILIVQVFYYRS